MLKAEEGRYLSVLLTEEQNPFYLSHSRGQCWVGDAPELPELQIACGFLRSTWNTPAIQLSWHVAIRLKPSLVFAIKLLLNNGSVVW